MSQQFVVVRGQIESGKEVLAKQGARYTPRNKEELNRLLAAGVIAPLPGAEEEQAEGSEQDTTGEQQQAAAKEANEKPTTTRRPRS